MTKSTSAFRLALRLPVKFAVILPRLTWRAKATSPPAVTNAIGYVTFAIAIRRKGHHRRRPLVTVEREVLARKVALPGIRHLPSARRELIAPGKLSAVEA